MAVILCGGCPTEVSNSGRDCVASETSYTGAVLGTYEYNGAHDSDFYAVVWDNDLECMRAVWYASTSSWTYHNSARADATDAVKAAALEWYRPKWVQAAALRLDQHARAVKVGRVVRSLTKRGRNVGVVGEVRRIENSAYGAGKVAGISVAGKDKWRWVPVDRVEVVDPDPVDMTELRRQAAAFTGLEWTASDWVARFREL